MCNIKLSYYCLLIISFFLLCVSKPPIVQRDSDPLNIGRPWPSNIPFDVNLLTPSGNIQTIETDIPGDPLNPADFKRPIDKEHLSMNIGERRDPIEMAGLFQGDIKLTTPDEINNFPQMKLKNGYLIRNAVLDPKRRWTNGVIPYAISKSYDPNERSVVAAAIKEFHNKTCIRFVPRSNEKDYIHILKGDGCSSSVGKVGGAQAVSLGPGCLMVGVVMHELMHATGFWHEQSRNDRDDYITIVWENIQAGMEYNFKKYNWSEIQSLGVQYDPKSIMHYGPYAFAKDRQKPTIIPLSTDPIGQRDGFSLNDLEKIRKLYECVGTEYVNSIVVPPIQDKDACEDYSANCASWFESGECEKNPLWMKSNCRKSCLECGKECGNNHKNCVQWASEGECTKNPSFMLLYCKLACVICSNGSSAPSKCKDLHSHCSVWSKDEQCRMNPQYMIVNCRKSCKQC